PRPLVALRDICCGCTKAVGIGANRTSTKSYEYATREFIGKRTIDASLLLRTSSGFSFVLLVPDCVAKQPGFAPSVRQNNATGKSLPICGNRCQAQNLRESKIFLFSRSAKQGIAIVIPSRPEGRRPSS